MRWIWTRRMRFLPRWWKWLKKGTDSCVPLKSREWRKEQKISTLKALSYLQVITWAGFNQPPANKHPFSSIPCHRDTVFWKMKEFKFKIGLFGKHVILLSKALKLFLFLYQRQSCHCQLKGSLRYRFGLNLPVWWAPGSVKGKSELHYSLGILF